MDDIQVAEQYIMHFKNVVFGLTPAVCSAKGSLADFIRTPELLKRFVIESDAPYFALPYVTGKGGSGHPGLGIFVADAIARAQQMQTTHVLKVIRKTTASFYGV